MRAMFLDKPLDRIHPEELECQSNQIRAYQWFARCREVGTGPVVALESQMKITGKQKFIETLGKKQSADA